jgi:bifunctional UDP-N-acetylglucosamine pyrophosphorylase/glucosamine-1-phosphate N-acetyltransferase
LSDVAAIILAAGKSTRMKSDLPKVLHEICGQPMLSFVLQACRLVGVDRLVVVVGHGKELVQQHYASDSDLTWVDQTEQKGTGHAVLCCREALRDFDDDGTVLVIAGDMPLIRRETLANLVESRSKSRDAATLATTILDEPTGYGRILRDDQGNIEQIIEEVDCTPEQRGIREVNPSYYCFESGRLFEALDNLKPTGANGEYYITDAVRILQSLGHNVSADVRVPSEDAMGINSRLDLAAINRVMQDRIQFGLMSEGVTIVDPDNTWIEADAAVGRDTVVYPFTFIGTGAIVGDRCRIGPFVHVDVGEVVDDGAVCRPSPPQRV